MKKYIKMIICIACAVLLIGLIFLAWYLSSVHNYKDRVAATTITEIDLTKVADGTYLGDYDVDFIYAKVEVTVQGGRITDIQLLEHKNGRGTPAESIVGDILEQQRVNVDAVSGATNSSTVIKKAVENALMKGEKANE